jgi:aryl-alcohol dehydrogenase-like predicted oxidoreductase
MRARRELERGFVFCLWRQALEHSLRELGAQYLLALLIHDVQVDNP